MYIKTREPHPWGATADKTHHDEERSTVAALHRTTQHFMAQPCGTAMKATCASNKPYRHPKHHQAYVGSFFCCVPTLDVQHPKMFSHGLFIQRIRVWFGSMGLLCFGIVVVGRIASDAAQG